MNDFKNFINGQWVGSDKTFENRNPVDNSLIGLVHEASASQVDEAVRAARAALTGPWAQLKTQQRVDLLHALVDGIERRFDDFLDAEIKDTGKPHVLASHVDIPRGAANFKVFADLIRNIPTETFPMDTPDGGRALNYGVRTPRGVIGVVCPWNLPLLLMTWKVGPALACGNTVVVKPSEETPATATLLGEVMNEVGIPAGVYNVVHGFGPDSAGQFLTEHPDVDGITFTGETGTGEVIMKAAAKGVRPVSFELGGKNPGIVFADADFDKAVAGITRSAFENSGQVCLGTERVYVQRPIFERFVQALKEKAESFKLADPYEKGMNFGPLVSLVHRKKVLGYYEKARAEGATIVTGGGVPDMPAPMDQGAWVQPTIWTGLPETSPVIREEIFGPCCHITPFDTEEEVIAMANATSYGLAATVWTQDLGTAHRLGAALNVGLCWINSWFLRDLRTSFGGAKQSGIGREGGVHSMEFYTELRNVCIKL
ncbi:2-hydroxymuconic semialdehyde dehydrogenase [Pusillimonas noertemannii]|uniref:2-hydroxymuconate semialdehyde dehydrogenase n=1 Tax=Pusillimonas noertemannii TaxID=305977 RepID=A0A2U1CL88_9BURK|nr:2-hydroxymuconic semialdehyde dehydrogenase [Pusillimonas noertemannii]NYT69286.1 2-hydroxymuconic semialdehyde dehydrogenase [Pusillimonas noertemannii]PVY61753.1 2-hydroxymuconate semialdehyde dehydrogenase [Pusillimonas noertemannii]TFL09689.1 2-hydroxymuconic semialdehyde dehydrogenase [Pusillimonas noertemannii]